MYKHYLVKKVLNKIIDYIEKIEYVLLILFVITFTLGVLTRVINRYVTHQGLPALQTVTVFAFVWIVFLAPNIGIRLDAHFKFDVLSNSVKPTVRKIINILVDLSILISAIVIIYTSIPFFSLGLNKIAYGGVGLSMVWGNSSILVGGILMAISAVARIVALFNNHDYQSTKDKKHG